MPATQGRHRLGMSTPAFVVELLKLTRSSPMTRPEIRREMGVAEDTAYEWVAELVAGGLLVERDNRRAPGQRGNVAKAYALSPEWGGRP